MDGFGLGVCTVSHPLYGFQRLKFRPGRCKLSVKPHKASLAGQCGLNVHCGSLTALAMSSQSYTFQEGDDVHEQANNCVYCAGTYTPNFLLR